MTDLIQSINTFSWIASNLLILYIWVGLIVFTTGYYILFDPRATTAGKFIFRFFVSLVGVMSLIFIGTFIDPYEGHEWWVYPEEVETWQPIFRLIAYGYVSHTITSLAVLITIRKWLPDRLKTDQTRDLIRTRMPQQE